LTDLPYMMFVLSGIFIMLGIFYPSQTRPKPVFFELTVCFQCSIFNYTQSSREFARKLHLTQCVAVLRKDSSDVLLQITLINAGKCVVGPAFIC
jgi:hypothetical protein